MKPKDLQHIAPTLARLQGKGNGMQVPEDYFEEFDVTITKLNSNEQEFKVPKSYFETVEDNVFKSLGLKEESHGQFKDDKAKQPKQGYLWLSLAVAASLVVALLLQNPFTQQHTFDVADVEMWLDSGELDISVVELADLLENDFENTIIEDHLDKDDVEDYLLDEISSYDLY